MRLLLDTHTFIWYADGSSQMTAAATALLADPANDLFLSMASVWEIAIKSGLKKLTLSLPFADYIAKGIAGFGLAVVPIEFDDCVAFEALPFPLKEHRDPFDRLIITHAKRNGMSVVGADVEFDAYGISRLW